MTAAMPRPAPSRGNPRHQPPKAPMTARDLPFAAALKLAKDFAGIEERLPHELAGHYPHVLAQIEALWPEPPVSAYLDSLLFADRPDRQGFTDEALAEVFFVKQLHEFLYPDAPAHSVDAASHAIAGRMRPGSVQELAQWYPARKAEAKALPEPAAPDARGGAEPARQPAA